MRRIVIIGAGAIGSVLGGLLGRAGYTVTLIGRSRHIEAIRAHGLQIEGATGTFSVAVEARETLDSVPDLAILAVKTQDVITALQANEAYLQHVPIVTCQNGVRSDELAATVVGQTHLISSVVNIHATYLEPGQATLIYPGPLVIGRAFGRNDGVVQQVAAVLSTAVPTSISANIHGVHWFKLMVNLNNVFPALTNLPFQAIYQHQELAHLAARVMREGLAVVQAAGIRLEGLPDTPAALIRLVGMLPVPLAARLITRRAQQMEQRWPLFGSTLQSIRRNRPIEIDYLNGEVVRLAQQQQIAAPLNRALVAMVHRVAQTGEFVSVEALPRMVASVVAQQREQVRV
jgi:2-dehydropantoate 2-reductase